MARLVGQAVGLVARPGERTHRAVSDRVFAALGPLGRPVRTGHDAVTTITYRAVRGTALLAGEAVAAASALYGPRRPLLDRSALGSGVVAAVNGLLGDRLAAQGNDLDLGMALRHAGRDLPVRTADLRAAYPAAGGHLVLLVPGLGETEHAWRFRRSRREPERPDYGTRLAADLAATPLYLRYNTGRPLAVSAEALSELLAALVERWPVPVRRIDLIGHSMGGLVCRLACGHGVAAGARWPELVRHVVYLGSPHAGAALARGAAAVAGLLSARPASRAWGEFLDLRSAGIQNLSGGLAGLDCPPLASAEHHTVVAELTGSELLGDLLVRSTSADIGVGDRLRIAPAHHLDLLNHPLVHRALRDWLGERDRPVSPAPCRG
ncbi:esterase/lipase family protein [Pseudonocardia acaciae]|uniref:esterase/lipase family protein n=1 Tax=Pseudonocardia acaciae TaxID=551276 RepID=UPI000687DC7A|nr:alpha/beta hydrolase [Pseudonocardia acaciae]